METLNETQAQNRPQHRGRAGCRCGQDCPSSAGTACRQGNCNSHSLWNVVEPDHQCHHSPILSRFGQIRSVGGADYHPLWQVVQGNSGCHHHTCQKEPSPLRTCLQPAYQLLQEPDPPAARQYAGRCRRKRGEPWPRLNGIGQQVCTHHSKHHARRKAQQHTHGPVRTSAEQIGGQAPQPGPSHACRGRDSYDRTHNLLSLP